MLYLSIGHSGGEVGAVANGTTEFNECEKIGKIVVERLRKEYKLDVQLVDTTVKLVPRINLINSIAKKEDILIELHMDSAGATAEGCTMFYYMGDKKSEEMSNTMLDIYSKFTNVRKRKVLGDTQNRHGRLAIVRDTKPRAFLIELGFLTSMSDFNKMRANSVEGLVQMCADIFGLEKDTPEEKVADWAEASFRKAEKKGFTRQFPSEIVGTARLRKSLIKAGMKIEDNGKPVSYQELVVGFDRVGILNQ